MRIPALLLTCLLAAVSPGDAEAKVWKRIRQPAVMAAIGSVNNDDTLTVREVVFSDTATTLRLTLRGREGDPYMFDPSLHLADEDGHRYRLHSAEGAEPFKTKRYGESRTADLTFHFDPMPRRVRVFDLCEMPSNWSWCIIGIHDRRERIVCPTEQEIAAAHPFTMPAGWLRSDTVTLRGHDATGVYTHLVLADRFDDLLGSEREESTVITLDVRPDSTFEKRVAVSMPFFQTFRSRQSLGLARLPVFACPGDTVDVEITSDYFGMVFRYGSGAGRELSRWLNNMAEADLLFRGFSGTFAEATVQAERSWQTAMYWLQNLIRRHSLTDMEVQLALTQLQVLFARAYLSYAMGRDMRLDGGSLTPSDSAEWLLLRDAAAYTPMRHVDFDNPLLLPLMSNSSLLNRVMYFRPARYQWWKKYGESDGSVPITDETVAARTDIYYDAYRRLMHTGQRNSLVAQLCIYQQMLGDMERFPLYSTTFTHPYLQTRAGQVRDAWEARRKGRASMTEPLPTGNAAADTIRSILARYPGRYLFIDFWGMSCGPCLSAIQKTKALREELRRRDDLKLVFIAEERRPGGSDAYRRYVAEWLDGEETVCVNLGDFSRFEEMFRFNAIPHYELITPDGRVVQVNKPQGYADLQQHFDALVRQLKSTDY